MSQDVPQGVFMVQDIKQDTLQITKALQGNMPIDPDFNTNRQFVLVGQDDDYALSIGGTVRLTGLYERDADNKEAIDMCLDNSNIVFNFVGKTPKDNIIGVFIGLVFNADNKKYVPALDHAYLRYNSLTLGNTYTTYNDPIASLFTIESTAPVASGNASSFIIRWEPKIRNWRFGSGIEQVRYSYTYANPDSLSGIDQRIPDVPLFISYEPSDKWHLRLSGVLRGLEYEITDNSPYHINPSRSVAFGWGVKLTGHFNFYPVKGYWMIQTGKGSASFQSGNRNKGLDLVPSADGKMTTPWGIGATLGVQINWLPSLYSVFKGSYLRNYIDTFEDANNTYEKLNLHMANAKVNLLYEIHKILCVGIEYCLSYNMTTIGKEFMSHRVLAMMYVSF